MTCKECRQLIKTGQLTETRHPDAFVHLQQCESCHALWTALRMIGVPGQLDCETPRQLADRVADAILSPAPNGSQMFHTIQLPGRKQKLVRTIIQAAAAALIIAAGSALLTLTIASPSGEPGTITVHLRLEAPHANAVSVVGDWNGWQPGTHNMVDKEENGIWELSIEISPEREYQYQFLINNSKWVPDPNAPIQVDDGFGGINSVINL